MYFGSKNPLLVEQKTILPHCIITIIYNFAQFVKRFAKIFVLLKMLRRNFIKALHKTPLL